MDGGWQPIQAPMTGTSANRNQSNIALVFSAPEIQLRQWIVTDNQGGTTTVALSGTLTGVSLDDSLFDVPRKASGFTFAYAPELLGTVGEEVALPLGGG